MMRSRMRISILLSPNWSTISVRAFRMLIWCWVKLWVWIREWLRLLCLFLWRILNLLKMVQLKWERSMSMWAMWWRMKTCIILDYLNWDLILLCHWSINHIWAKPFLMWLWKEGWSILASLNSFRRPRLRNWKNLIMRYRLRSKN